MSDVRQRLGKIGEDVAARHYQSLGYRVVARNWRHGKYELDLVVARQDSIVFVEVKSRRSRLYGFPEEAVHMKKQGHFQSCVEAFLAEHTFACHSIELQVCSIIFSGQNIDIRSFSVTGEEIIQT